MRVERKIWFSTKETNFPLIHKIVERLIGDGRHARLGTEMSKAAVCPSSGRAGSSLVKATTRSRCLPPAVRKAHPSVQKSGKREPFANTKKVS